MYSFDLQADYIGSDDIYHSTSAVSEERCSFISTTNKEILLYSSSFKR